MTRASRPLIRLLGEADAAGEALDPATVWPMLDDVAPREAIAASILASERRVGADRITQPLGRPF